MARPILGDLLRKLTSVGLPSLAGQKPQEAQQLRVYVDVEHRRHHVGTLTYEGEFWVFRYAEPFVAQAEIPPISAFPDKTKSYRSRHLWPFFHVRVPPQDRDDVRDALQERGIRSSDTFGILAVLGGRTPTSPYEFELPAPGATG
jgi:HipA-like protein